MSPGARLYTILKSFEPAELRRLAVREADWGELAQVINWDRSSADVADAVTTHVERAGAGAAFYRALLAARPAHAAEIRALAEAAGFTLAPEARPDAAPTAPFDGAWSVGPSPALLAWTGTLYAYVEFGPGGFPVAIGRAQPASGGLDVTATHAVHGPFTARLQGSGAVLQGTATGRFGATPVVLERRDSPAIAAWRSARTAELVGDGGVLLAHPPAELGLFGPVPPVEPWGRWSCGSPAGPFVLDLVPGGWRQLNPMGMPFGQGTVAISGPLVQLSGWSENAPLTGVLLVDGLRATGALTTSRGSLFVQAQRVG